MMIQKRTILLLVLLFQMMVIVGYSQSQNAKIKKTEWLIGTWVNETKRGNIYETWIKLNDQELFGKSYQVQEQDTVVMETVRLVEESDNLFYIPTVNNQNQGEPVRFAMSRLTESEMKFENPKHDSPQVIYYRKEGDNDLLAEIWAVRDGQTRKIQFPMKRIR
ncbi:MAG: DUF6265 family protein [Bacteroidota bacterium]